MRHFNQLEEPLVLDSKETFDPIRSYLVRVSQQQFSSQIQGGNEIARTLMLYERIPVSHFPEAKFDEEFQREFGIPVSQFIAVGAHIMARTFKRGPRFSRDEISQELRNWSLSPPDAVDVFLARVSATREQVQATAARFPPPNETHEMYRYNPLVKHPIIELAPSEYIVPNVSFLYNRFTSELYWDFMDSKRSDVQRQWFLNFFGDVFQAYVGEVLKPYCLDLLLPEQTYGRKREPKQTVDWFVLNSDPPSRIVCLECKTARLRRDSKLYGSLDSFETDLEKCFLKALGQLKATEDLMGQGSELPEVLRCKDVIPVVVVPDPLFLANSTPYRDCLRKVIETRKPSLLELVDRFQVIELHELEAVAPLARMVNLADLLAAKTQQAPGDPLKGFAYDWWAKNGDAESFPTNVHLNAITDGFLNGKLG